MITTTTVITGDLIQTPRGVVMNKPTEEEDVIIAVINENIQILIDSSEQNQKAITRLQESLQALRDYHSREIIQGVYDGLNPQPF